MDARTLVRRLDNGKHRRASRVQINKVIPGFPNIAGTPESDFDPLCISAESANFSNPPIRQRELGNSDSLRERRRFSALMGLLFCLLLFPSRGSLVGPVTQRMKQFR